MKKITIMLIMLVAVSTLGFRFFKHDADNNLIGSVIYNEEDQSYRITQVNGGEKYVEDLYCSCERYACMKVSRYIIEYADLTGLELDEYKKYSKCLYERN